ncbi:MAG: hypothetical protein MUC83_07435 [Pirellula sp.]|jgi:hypothetical protein|nr:hypothetical protein [Pirellula sp.]
MISALRGHIAQVSVFFLVFYAAFGIKNVFSSDPEPFSRFVRLSAPWQRGVPSDSSFEILFEGTRLRIRGDVADADIIGPIKGEKDFDDAGYDCILFAWSRSPYALEFEGVEILPSGQFNTVRKDSSNNELQSASDLQPEIHITESATGFRFECLVRIQADATDAANNETLYISLSQIDASRDGEASRWYCSDIPATLQPKRFSASSFAPLDWFPSEKLNVEQYDVLVQSKLANSSFRIAELELRNKWNRYAFHPSIMRPAQKWYDDLISFPDAERFLERTRNGVRLQTIDPGDARIPKRLTDARSERISKLLGQSWSVHLGRIEDLGTCLPLSIATSKSVSDAIQSESLEMWLENDRLQIALFQNGDGVYWGSTNWPIAFARSSERVTSITLASDGSTNGVGYELYANSKPLEIVAHNANNLRLRPDSLPVSGMQSKLIVDEWQIRTTNASLQVDLYNTKLTPIEVLSLDPNATLLSWSELTEEQREAWRLHYVFCVDPEGRYYLESLKHYTSSQAELLRRSGKPAKK